MGGPVPRQPHAVERGVALRSHELRIVAGGRGRQVDAAGERSATRPSLESSWPAFMRLGGEPPGQRWEPGRRSRYRCATARSASDERHDDRRQPQTCASARQPRRQRQPEQREQQRQTTASGPYRPRSRSGSDRPPARSTPALSAAKAPITASGQSRTPARGGGTAESIVGSPSVGVYESLSGRTSDLSYLSELLKSVFHLVDKLGVNVRPLLIPVVAEVFPESHQAEQLRTVICQEGLVALFGTPEGAIVTLLEP